MKINFIYIDTGITRLVFLIGNYAIKIPNFTYCHQHFLQGCYANWSERKYTKTMLPNFLGKISPTIYCSWFGLLSIQYRVSVNHIKLTKKQKEYFSEQTTDFKPSNFGYLNNKLVCIDYV